MAHGPWPMAHGAVPPRSQYQSALAAELDVCWEPLTSPYVFVSFVVFVAFVAKKRLEVVPAIRNSLELTLAKGAFPAPGAICLLSLSEQVAAVAASPRPNLLLELNQQGGP